MYQLIPPPGPSLDTPPLTLPIFLYHILSEGIPSIFINFESLHPHETKYILGNRPHATLITPGTHLIILWCHNLNPINFCHNSNFLMVYF